MNAVETEQGQIIRELLERVEKLSEEKRQVEAALDELDREIACLQLDNDYLESRLERERQNVVKLTLEKAGYQCECEGAS